VLLQTKELFNYTQLIQVLNESDGCHGPTIQDGPFPWNNSIEVNSILENKYYFKGLNDYMKK